MADLPIKSFERGITDDYIDGPLNAMKRADNLLIDRHRKLYQRPGFDIYNENAPQIPPGNQRIDAIYRFDLTVFAKSGTKLYYLEDGDLAWTTLDGPNADAFADSALGAGCSFSEWRGHLYITPHPGSLKTGSRTVKVFRDDTNAWKLYQAGVPSIKEEDPADGIPATGSGDGSTEHSYIFARVYTAFYTAKVNGIDTTFIFYGRPEYDQITVNKLTATSDLVYFNYNFTNDTLENYMDGNFGSFRMHTTGYRTKSDEQTLLYLAKEVQTTAFDLAVDDDDLGQTSAAYEDPIIYTDGNVKDNGPVPVCYFSLILDGYAFYAAGVDYDSERFYPGRVWQSNPANPEGVFYGNYVDVPGVITGLSYVGSYPVIFTNENKCYRIEGRFDAFGGGGMRAKLISDSDGCIAPAAIVRKEDKIIFATSTGWSETNGFQCWKISEHLRKTYEDLIDKEDMCSAYDVASSKIFFGVQSDLVETGSNNTLFIMDTDWSTEADGVFTTASADADLKPNSLHYDHTSKVMLIGDRRGYVFKFVEDLTTDPKVNTAIPYAQWYRKAVVYDYISTAWSFGNVTMTKWVTKIYLILKNLTGHVSIDIFSYTDDKATAKRLKPIRIRKSVTEGLHQAWRWFKRGELRCNYKQVQFKKGFVTLFRSDDHSLANTDSGGLTAQLVSGHWPDDNEDSLVGHVLYLGDDDYTEGWEISVHSGDTLTVLDPTFSFPTSVTPREWIVRGFPKGETFELHGYDVEYTTEDNTFEPFRTGQSGDNT